MQKRIPVPVVFAFLLLVVEVIWNIINPSLVASLGICIVFLLLYIGVQSYELHTIKTTHSHVVPYISKYPTLEDIVHDYRRNPPNIVSTSKRYYLPFRQAQCKDIRLADTQPVHAEISFYDMVGNKLNELSQGEAFWYNDKPRVKMQDRNQNEVVIKKSGEIEGVCLVIKQVGSKDLYAFNHNSYVPGTGDFRWEPSMKIKDKSIYVEVEISDGVFKNKVFWVKVTNLESREHPYIKLLETPPFIEMERDKEQEY